MAATLANRPVESYALRLRGIRVRSHIGVSDAERREPQELVLAVDLDFDGGLYPPSDDIERAADYAEIVRAAGASACEKADCLLETFARRVALRIAARFPAAERLRVAVTKASVPVEPLTEAASVEITLGAVRC